MKIVDDTSGDQFCATLGKRSLASRLRLAQFPPHTLLPATLPVAAVTLPSRRQPLSCLAPYRRSPFLPRSRHRPRPPNLACHTPAVSSLPPLFHRLSMASGSRRLHATSRRRHHRHPPILSAHPRLVHRQHSFHLVLPFPQLFPPLRWLLPTDCRPPQPQTQHSKHPHNECSHCRLSSLHAFYRRPRHASLAQRHQPTSHPPLRVRV